MSVVDHLTERAARWMASRTSRRTFLASLGKAAVVGVGGVAVAAVFDDHAQARVCGQSGISPRCPTYDCLSPGFWGWCWYASPGCCANGGLKKICDCCLTGWPNVQGYCPGGSAVYCVVESCLEDPRVMRIPIERWKNADIAELSLARLAMRPSRSASTVVVSEAGDPLVAAMALPVAAELGAPLLLVDPSSLRAGTIDELTRVGANRIVLVGPRISDAVISALTIAAPVDRIHGPLDIASVSVEVGVWLLNRTGRSDVVVIGADPESVALSASAAAVAAHRVAPVLITSDAIGAVAASTGRLLRPLLIGASVNGLTGADPVTLSRTLAEEVLSRDGGNGLTIALAPVGSAASAVAIAPIGGVVILHDPGRVSDVLRDWALGRRARFARGELVLQGAGALGNDGVHILQSALNGFDAHQLSGGGGDGLPVWPQLPEERTLGRARVGGAPPSTSMPQKNVRKRVPEDLIPVPTVVMPPPPVPSTTTTSPTAAAGVSVRAPASTPTLRAQARTAPSTSATAPPSR